MRHADCCRRYRWAAAARALDKHCVKINTLKKPTRCNLWCLALGENTLVVAAGVALGLLIGLISGSVFLLLLKTATYWSEKGASLILPLVGQLLAIPTFMGGGWISGRFLDTLFFKGTTGTNLVPYYVVSFTVTFFVMFAYPAVRWIVRLGEELGRRP